MRRRHLVRAAVLVCGAIVSSPLAAAQNTKAPATKAPPASRPVRAAVQGFSVVLLLGDLQGGTTADNVPAAARKALVDMRDFLPYKGYRLLDTGWTLASNNGVRSTLRLRGLEHQEFELVLGGAAPEAGPIARLNLSFRLSEAGPDGLPPADPEVTIRSRMSGARQSVSEFESRLATFDRESAIAEKQLEPVTDPAERRDAQARRGDERMAIVHQLGAARERLRQLLQGEQIGAVARGGRRIIDTAFSMDVGETVVVGTSRLGGGDKAIIALLTAVARAR